MSPDLFPNREAGTRTPETVQQPERRFEVPVIVEKKQEQEFQPERTPQEESEYARKTAPVPVQHDMPQPTVALGQKSEQVIAIEKILEDHIADLYVRIPDKDKPAFRSKGEEVAQKIDSLLKQAKVQAKKIFDLILSWLKMVPGVNKFFIEQEAAIKTDSLIALKNKKQ